MSRVLSDQPIRTREKDELEASAFAQRLVKPLVEWPTEQSLVLGLFAPWGAGKSSVLNLLWSELRQWKGPDGRRAIPVRFNPWLYSDTPTLLSSFFGTLATAASSSEWLDRERRKAAADAIRKFAGVVVPVLSFVPAGNLVKPVVRASATAVKHLLKSGETGLEADRELVVRAMTALADAEPPARMVVLIDDLDRVEDDELRAMLRLVKLVADLPNISYLIAVDYTRVREVIAGDRLLSYGQSFLEKIVQVPIHLPTVSAEKVEQLVKEAVSDVLEEAGLSSELLLEPDSPLYPVDFYQKTIGHRVSTLRDRARLVNTLRFMLLAGDESLRLHPLDAILIAFLHTFYPDAYHRIRRNREFLTEGRGLEEIALEVGKKVEEAADIRRNTLYRIISGIDGFSFEETSDDQLRSVAMTRDDVRAVEAAMKYLFPQALSGDQLQPSEYAELLIENRVQVPERFDRYFTFRPPPDEVSDEFVEDVIQSMSSILASGDDEARQKAGAVLARVEGLGADRQASFIEKFHHRMSRVPLEVVVPLASVVVEATEKLGQSAVEDIAYALAKRAASASATPESSTDGRDAAAEVLEIVLSGVPSAPHAVLFANEVLRLQTSTVFLTEETRRYIAGIAAERMTTYAGDARNVFEDMGAENGGRVIWRWRDLLKMCQRDVSVVREYVTSLLSRDVSSLPHVLSLFGAWSVGREPKPTLDSTLVSPRDVLASAEELIGLEQLETFADEFVAGDAKVAEHDVHGLVAQFLKLIAEQGESSAETEQTE